MNGKHRVARIRFDFGPNGTTVTSYGQTPRGNKFIVGSLRLAPQEKGSEAEERALGDAVAQLMGAAS